MDDQMFEAEVERLGSTLMATIEAFFALRGATFDPVAFSSQSSTDFDQIARDAMFFGAEIFPALKPVAAAA